MTSTCRAFVAPLIDRISRASQPFQQDRGNSRWHRPCTGNQCGHRSRGDVRCDMYPDQNSITVAVKRCASCESGLLERDRFCRRCGVRQPAHSTSRNLFTAAAVQRGDTAGGSHEARLCRKVSGPLVDAVIDGISPSGSARTGSFVRASILALVSVPIWLMIVLLSPLDAYAAARSLVRQI